MAIAGPAVDAARIFAAGAQALLPAELAAVAAFVEHLLSEPRSSRSRREISATGVQRLHRVYDELRSGLTSATVALTLMRLISESFDRAVLFLPSVTPFQCSALSASARRAPLAVAAKGLVLRSDGGRRVQPYCARRNLHRVELSPER